MSKARSMRSSLRAAGSVASVATLAALTTFATLATPRTAFAADAGVDAGPDAGPFTYDPPGQLVPTSGTGRVDTKVYAPGIRFPMESGPAFANSQVWGVGGNSGPSGSQCSVANFSYPWHDNYCEERDWDMPLCPGGTGHQGQDIRAATCEKRVHWVVAVADGTITNVGSYSVYLTTADGTRFDFLHMDDLAIKEGDKVTRGQRLGKVSNNFGGSATTVHMHFNIRQNVEDVGDVYVPPYMSIIKSYETMMGIAQPEDAGTDAEAPPVTPPPPPPVETAAPVAEEPPAAPAEDGESGCDVATSRAGASAAVTPFAALGLALAAIATSRRRRRRS